ncbi:YbhB/YbcL family Raf kinase inhibitor-like protein [Palaeococcus ferrophilus]|uniref:YbhB/YbcL family Raf kinase inhibitor-like protein n=1 Tax=Palaeococcus ferrophilus TaxID=83868 RepID=UPI00064F9E80|nr:YbhB/YbcL family Raf kinase inhibitor-like protein [Palaeococcus ferrophilus]
MKRAVPFVVALLLLSAGCLGGDSLKVSSVFGDGEVIPVKYTCDGIDVNPPLYLEGLSDEAVSVAIIVDDPDAPFGTFTHWVAWNLPPVKEIPEALPKNGTVSSPISFSQGRNDFGRTGYNGPCPPRGKPHHYRFKVYVLDTMLDLKPGATKKELERAMEGHVIQKGELVGLYARK